MPRQRVLRHYVPACLPAPSVGRSSDSQAQQSCLLTAGNGLGSTFDNGNSDTALLIDCREPFPKSVLGNHCLVTAAGPSRSCTGVPCLSNLLKSPTYGVNRLDHQHTIIKSQGRNLPQRVAAVKAPRLVIQENGKVARLGCVAENQPRRHDEHHVKTPSWSSCRCGW